MPKPDYDTTLARIAGNIASGLMRCSDLGGRMVKGSVETFLHHSIETQTAQIAVSLARAIVDEVKRTAPVSPTDEWVEKSQIKGGSAIAEKIDNLGNPNENEKATSRRTEG